MFILSFESLQQLHHLLNYIGCQQTAICNEGMFSHIMTTDSWCQTGYAFQFVSGNNNNYSSCKSLLHYRIHFAAHISQNPTPIIWDRQRRVQLINFPELGLTLNYAPELLEPLELDSPIKNVKMLSSDAKGVGTLLVTRWWRKINCQSSVVQVNGMGWKQELWIYRHLGYVMLHNVF